MAEFNDIPINATSEQIEIMANMEINDKNIDENSNNGSLPTSKVVYDYVKNEFENIDNNVVDQTFDGTSENAQSGKAVAEAISENIDNNKILDYIEYDINETDNTVTITGCDKSISGDYIIPDTIRGYPVTSIVDYAFYDCDSLTSITIPDSVTTIAGGVFSNCSNLTSITIPNSVTQIRGAAFKNCESLKSITLPDSITTIWPTICYGCSGLISVIIPDSVTKIGDGAFFDCSSLTDVYYKGSQEQWEQISIGNENDSLTSATIHYNQDLATKEAVAEAIKDKADKSEIPIVDQEFYIYSSNAQSGKAIHTGVVEPLVTELNGKVDKTSLIAGIDLQDNITAEELKEALSIPIVDQEFYTYSSNAQSGKAVASALSRALSTTLLRSDLLSKISEEKADQKYPINSRAVIDYVSANYYNKTEIDTNKQDKATLNDNTVIIDNILALEDNAEYRMTDINTLTLTYPNDNFECWLRISFAETGNITVNLPSSQYIGAAPKFSNGETWEISIKDGIVIAQKVSA